MSSRDASAAKITRIGKNNGVAFTQLLRDVWDIRELFFVLVVRDIKVRYKQTFVGIGWAVFQPVMTMIVFTLFFGNLAKMPSDGIPYPLFSFAAIVPWQYFARAATDGTNSLLASSGMLSKVYFPREILPAVAVAQGLLDFLIGMVILFLLMGYFAFVPSWNILYLPLFFLLLMALALAVAMWLSSIAAVYRDVGFITPYFIQLVMFLTPVIYPTSLVPEAWRFYYRLNPMVQFIDGFRWSLLGTGEVPDPLSLGLSFAVVLLLLLGGLVYFQRAVRVVVDKI